MVNGTATEGGGKYLSSSVLIPLHALRLERGHRPAIGRVADMVRAGAAAVDAVDEVCVGLCLGEGLEDAFAHGGAADVAEADEEDGDFVGHVGIVRDALLGNL